MEGRELIVRRAAKFFRDGDLVDDDIFGHENLLVPFTDKLDFLCASAPLRAVPVSRSVHPAQCTDGGTANNR